MAVRQQCSSRAASLGHGCGSRHHRVLPPHVTAVAMKTPAVKVMAGAQIINNQLKAAMVTATEAVTMTATTMMMEMKGTAAAAEGWQLRGGGGQLGGVGGQLGGGGGSLARALCW